MTIWFTSDLHFGHANLIKSLRTIFKNVDDMNENLVSNYNSLVGKNDLVFILGDFAFCDPTLFANRLNGKKHLILGNHDYSKLKKLRECNFMWMKDVHELKFNNMRFWLSHYAHVVWPKKHYGAYHLYGHSHGKLIGAGRSMDVGVDVLDYKPISIDDVVSRLNAKVEPECSDDYV